jgi:murein DD-endopeptidase MepM/ murein hydrolase activator NlpD
VFARAAATHSLDKRGDANISPKSNGVVTLPSIPTGLGQWRSRFAHLFQDHEIFVRTHGQVRFLRISAALQKRVAAIVAIILFAWAAFTIAMLVNQWLTADERAAVAAQQVKAAAAEARIAKYQGRIVETAADLDERQAHLEGLLEQHFGGEAANLPAADPAATGTAAMGTAEPLKTSMINPALPPEAQALSRIETRQNAFAARLLSAVNARAAQAEMAVAKLGLNPNALVQDAARGRGGPLIPYTGRMGSGGALGPAFAALEGALFRMEVLERTLVAVPSGNPANIMMMSSGFGYRSDPFTGGGAMHNGLDFKGPTGTAILAAAPGRISSVGAQGGYGNTVEIDHGQGIMTRYAHLSGFDARVGDVVAAGQQIGRMGSTGRSTGSHLHFEVRINGAAVNPRRFLEVNDDVREVKADARERVAAVARSQ